MFLYRAPCSDGRWRANRCYCNGWVSDQNSRRSICCYTNCNNRRYGSCTNTSYGSYCRSNRIIFESFDIIVPHILSLHLHWLHSCSTPIPTSSLCSYIDDTTSCESWDELRDLCAANFRVWHILTWKVGHLPHRYTRLLLWLCLCTVSGLSPPFGLREGFPRYCTLPAEGWSRCRLNSTQFHWSECDTIEPLVYSAVFWVVDSNHWRTLPSRRVLLLLMSWSSGAVLILWKRISIREEDQVCARDGGPF